MQVFKINNQYEAICNAEYTRNGFRHLASLVKDGQEIASAKCNYLNRTWERYQFESVLQKLRELVDYDLRYSDLKDFDKAIESGGRYERDNLKSIALIAKMGELMSNNCKEQNDWKAKMLKAGLGEGVSMPDDWEQLSEGEKSRRLNGAIGELSK